jgi:hypothetical protein
MAAFEGLSGIGKKMLEDFEQPGIWSVDDLRRLEVV